MNRHYYVGVTKQGQETLAKRELERQNFGTYLPMCVKDWGGKIARVKPFLPSYIFIHLDPTCESWSCVNSTFGMRGFILTSGGERPQSVADNIIHQIKEREIDGLVRLPPKAQCRFQKGDRVRVKGNPVEALFEEVVDHRRAIVFLSLLGRANRLIVPLSKLTVAPVLSSIV